MLWMNYQSLSQILISKSCTHVRSRSDGLNHSLLSSHTMLFVSQLTNNWKRLTFHFNERRVHHVRSLQRDVGRPPSVLQGWYADGVDGPPRRQIYHTRLVFGWYIYLDSYQLIAETAVCVTYVTALKLVGRGSISEENCVNAGWYRFT